MAGCLGRQVSPSGRGEDARAPKGSKRAGWVIKPKTYKFLSCPPASVTPAFFVSYLRVPHKSRLGQVRDVADIKFFLCCVCVTEGHFF